MDYNVIIASTSNEIIYYFLPLAGYYLIFKSIVFFSVAFWVAHLRLE